MVIAIAGSRTQKSHADASAVPAAAAAANAVAKETAFIL